MVFPIGLYFPLFFIQLDAAKHGLDENFAFYSVGFFRFCLTAPKLTLPKACYRKRRQCRWPSFPWDLG